MFERIIVTLDGSASSEAALPAAEDIARRLGSSIVLLHVIEERPPKAVHGERHLATVAEAEAYLGSIVARLKAEGLEARSHVHDAAADSSGASRGAASREAVGVRGVVASVAAHEEEFGNDLAVMAAHGKHGLSETLSGSLPLKVAASGGAAVLLVPRPPAASRGAAPGDAAETAARALSARRLLVPLDGRPVGPAFAPGRLLVPLDGRPVGPAFAPGRLLVPLDGRPVGPAFAPGRLLVPLDGRPEHEAAVPAAVALAKAFGLGLRLLAVVPRSGAEAGGAGAVFARLAPALSGASLEYAAEGEVAYLTGVAQRLAVEGVEADWRVLRGRPAKAILSAAEKDDLIVLSTHRRLGIDASLDGCVAFGVAGSWPGAMLIVPLPRG